MKRATTTLIGVALLFALVPALAAQDEAAPGTDPMANAQHGIVWGELVSLDDTTLVVHTDDGDVTFRMEHDAVYPTSLEPGTQVAVDWNIGEDREGLPVARAVRAAGGAGDGVEHEHDHGEMHEHEGHDRDTHEHEDHHGEAHDHEPDANDHGHGDELRSDPMTSAEHGRVQGHVVRVNDTYLVLRTESGGQTFRFEHDAVRPDDLSAGDLVVVDWNIGESREDLPVARAVRAAD